MKKYSLITAAVLAAALLAAVPVSARQRSRADIRNALKSLYTPDYLVLKQGLKAQFAGVKPGKFGESVQGFKRPAGNEKKVIALTFDACGGRNSRYNARLIDYLRREKLPATLFVTGLWIDKHPEIFKELANDPLFEIENHGLMHRTCSVNGQKAYKVWSTRSVGDVVDEMELNARKIAEVSGRRPLFFRSATAFADEASVEIARRLGMEIVGYDILSGDAQRRSVKAMTRNILDGARHGSVVLMHFNRPEWKEVEVLEAAVPA
ncbi:MAG: hypothetical protein A3J79_02810, partial [Elusimicrobia bacterium RIFOXYB2_FULL_62_6]